MAINCPKCQRPVIQLFKCPKCGDVRCNNSSSAGAHGGCASSKSPHGRPEGANITKKCWVCGKGKYQKI